MVNKLTILKLGGSVVTKKSRPLTFNADSVRNLSKVIKKFKEPLIIVHGAGSFGHYYAKRYRISNKPTKSTQHVVKIRDSMQLLNQKIIKIFHANQVNTFSFSPTSMYNNKKIPINETHESPLVMLIPLFFLGIGALFAGFLFKETFIGHHSNEFS